MSPEPPPEPPLSRLDPDRAAASRPPSRPRAPLPAFNPRRVQWLAGAFALVLVTVFSVLQLTAGRPAAGTAGIPAGQALRPFAVPLAASNLRGDANLRPSCNAAHHDPRALNTCLLVHQAPLVLAFFVTDSGSCESSVDAVQRVAVRTSGVSFAAVAIRASAADTRAAAHRHHWTIPIAYDRDGAVGESFGIAVCPLLELVARGGIVSRRLIGERWRSAAALGPAVARLAGGA